ncbi:MAG: TonB-dependent receptor [Muribaculaceae bacterium]|nr:TonB-dependent receptor [Muribaculaceae bacterium]
MKKTVLSNSLPKLCLAMGLMLGTGAWNAYAAPTPTEAQQVRNEAGTMRVIGTVLDENGEPIIGASVRVKGTDISVPTDIDGKFNLGSLRGDQTIEISYVGYISYSLTINQLESRGGKIFLEPTAENLNEVIVVGYGTQKKVNLTGAVQQVTSKELTQRSVTSASLALQGLVSGMNVTQTSGAPGTSAGIQIRGVGSMNSNGSPLVLVDGVENDMNAIDMNAIESISVLKDAASASIYGSKASNGVILVTTKRGEESRAQVSYNGWVGFRTPTELPRPANAIEYMQQMDKANVNIGNQPTFTELIATYENEGVDNMARFDTNWRDMIMKSSMLTTNHAISITGGNKTIRQYLNGSYSYEDGIVANNNYNRWTIRSNTDATITKWLRANVNLSVRRTNREEPAYGSTALIGYALTFSPIYGAINADGTWNDGQSGINPVAMAEAGGKTHTDGTDAFVKGSLIANPVEGLEILASYSSRRYENKSASFTQTYETYSMGQPVRSYPATGKSRSEGWERSMFNQFNIQASFEKTWNKAHYFKAFVGFQTEESKYSQMGLSRSGFPYDGYEQMSHGNGTISGYGGRNELAMVSYIGRLNYIYNEKYMLEVTGRYDGSSRFTKENRWGFFPSVSAAWRISQENFFESAREYVNNLKLRLSYGTLGNQNIGGNYPYAAVLASGINYWPGGVWYSGIGASELSNRDISWEKSKQFNVGLDFALLGGRIDATFDYYVRNIDSMLQRFPAPFYVGLSSPWSNAGSMRNNGWDLAITYHDKFNRVNFSATAMISDVKNKITELYGNEYKDPSGGTLTTVGSPIWSWYGFVADGYFQSQEEIDNYPVYNGDKKNYRPGYIKYKDISGPEGKPDGVIDDHDRKIIGDPQQRYLFSLNLTANWNNFDFTAFFQGVGKRDIYATGYNVRPLMVGRTIMESQFDTWSEDNRNAKYPLLIKEDVAGSNPNNICSSFWIKSGAYCRLKNLVVGYSLPKNILSGSGISHLRFYVSGQNLFTIQNAYPGYDPEASPASYYPLMRVYTFGIDLRF